MAKKKENSPKGKKPEKDPKVNPEIKGYKVGINNFGEITSSFDIDRINEFLNKNVEDKKLKDREDLDDIKKGVFRKPTRLENDPVDEEKDDEDGEDNDNEEE